MKNNKLNKCYKSAQKDINSGREEFGLNKLNEILAKLEEKNTLYYKIMILYSEYFAFIGEWEISKHFSEIVSNYCKQNNQPHLEGLNFNALGMNYGFSELYKKSKESFLQAASIFLSIGEINDYVTARINLANATLNLKDFESALNYSLKTVQVIETLDTQDVPFYSLRNLLMNTLTIAYIYYELDDNTNALKYLNLSKQYSKKLDSKPFYIYTDHVNAILIYDRDPKTAIEYLKNAIEFYIEHNDNMHLEFAYSYLQKIYKNLGDQQGVSNILMKMDELRMKVNKKKDRFKKLLEKYKPNHNINLKRPISNVL